MAIHRLKVEDVRGLEKRGDVARISAEMRFQDQLKKTRI